MDGRLPGKALAPSRNRNVMTIILFRLLLGREREREKDYRKRRGREYNIAIESVRKRRRHIERLKKWDIESGKEFRDKNRDTWKKRN